MVIPYRRFRGQRICPISKGQDATDGLYRNVGKELHYTQHNDPEERRPLYIYYLIPT